MIRVLTLELFKGDEGERKVLSYTQEAVRKASLELTRALRNNIILLLTCNRAELWYEGLRVPPVILERSLRLNPLSVKAYEAEKEGEEAELYLFELAAGIHSPYFGEEIILHQLSSALEVAKSVGSVSANLDRLFRAAIENGRAIHKCLKVRVFDEEGLEELYGLLKGSTVLVIGSGEYARLVSSHLASKNLTVYQTLRDNSKADFLIPSGVKAIPFEERLAYALKADAVISASSAIGYTLTEKELSALEGKKLFDLASPSDFPLSVEAIRQLSSSTPKRDEVVRRVKELSLEKHKTFCQEMEKREELPFASALAFETASTFLRKEGHLLALEDNPELAAELFEGVRKAVMSAYFSRKSP